MDTSMARVAPKGVGNTKRPPASKHWCFTLNNYNEQDCILLDKILVAPNKYIVGLEVGENGTPHLQGYIEFATKCRPLEISDIPKAIHWEKCRSPKHAIEYCKKEDNYYTNMKTKRPLKILEDIQLYKWQWDIVNMITKIPDDRKIYWYWSKKGNTGKSTFKKYLCAKHDAIPMGSGKKSDILYCAAEYESDLYVFDFERSIEDHVSYGAIENVKDGCYMCPKYESKPVIRNSPHIIVFANFKPDMTQLSDDRWVIRNIDAKSTPRAPKATRVPPQLAKLASASGRSGVLDIDG